MSKEWRKPNTILGTLASQISYLDPGIIPRIMNFRPPRPVALLLTENTIIRFSFKHCDMSHTTAGGPARQLVFGM